MFFVKTSLLWELVHAMCHMFTQNSPFYTGKTLINPFDSGIFAEKTSFKAIKLFSRHYLAKKKQTCANIAQV